MHDCQQHSKMVDGILHSKWRAFNRWSWEATTQDIVINAAYVLLRTFFSGPNFFPWNTPQTVQVGWCTSGMIFRTIIVVLHSVDPGKAPRARNYWKLVQCIKLGRDYKFGRPHSNCFLTLVSLTRFDKEGSMRKYKYFWSTSVRLH